MLLCSCCGDLDLAGEQPMNSTLSSRVAVYTGVFDPVHYGHLDVIRRGSLIFDRLVVGVGINPDKTTFFTLDERVDMVRRVSLPFGNVEVRPFTGLAVHFVRQMGARIMFRGLRTLSDMEYEFSMSLTNRSLDPELETMFVMAKEDMSHISSSLIRQIAKFSGALEKFVPPEVQEALQAHGVAR